MLLRPIRVTLIMFILIVSNSLKLWNLYLHEFCLFISILIYKKVFHWSWHFGVIHSWVKFVFSPFCKIHAPKIEIYSLILKVNLLSRTFILLNPWWWWLNDAEVSLANIRQLNHLISFFITMCAALFLSAVLDLFFTWVHIQVRFHLHELLYTCHGYWGYAVV